jgi:diaminopimelate decarboxylase
LKEEVPMSLSAAEPLSPEQEALRRCVMYRSAVPMSEMALPALALRNHSVAKWVRDQDVEVDVRSSEDLGVSLAAGVHPKRMTIHADGLSPNEILFCTANLEVHLVVVNSADHVGLLTSVTPRRRRQVLVRMTDVNAPGVGSACEVEDTVNAILDRSQLDLIGLHCEIGSQERDFISYPAAIGQMIAEMAKLRQIRGTVLTHLALGGGRAVPSGDWAVQLPELADQIDRSLDDACATLHFPRPIIALSTGLAILGQQAA